MAHHGRYRRRVQRPVKYVELVRWMYDVADAAGLAAEAMEEATELLRSFAMPAYLMEPDEHPNAAHARMEKRRA